MGQYFTAIIKRENGKFERYCAHSYTNGVKLMEHAYIGNNFTETVIAQLIGKCGHVAWVGDYAKPGMVESPLDLEFITEEGKEEYNTPPQIPRTQNSIFLGFVNHTKKEYFIPWSCLCQDKYHLAPHPLPLLTAIGNGEGGGDYHGSSMDMIGKWACDEIEVLEDCHLIPQDYKNISNQLKFIEGGK